MAMGEPPPEWGRLRPVSGDTLQVLLDKYNELHGIREVKRARISEIESALGLEPCRPAPPDPAQMMPPPPPLPSASSIQPGRPPVPPPPAASGAAGQAREGGAGSGAAGGSEGEVPFNLPPTRYPVMMAHETVPMEEDIWAPPAASPAPVSLPGSQPSAAAASPAASPAALPTSGGSAGPPTRSQAPAPPAAAKPVLDDTQITCLSDGTPAEERGGSSQGFTALERGGGGDPIVAGAAAVPLVAPGRVGAPAGEESSDEEMVADTQPEPSSMRLLLRKPPLPPVAERATPTQPPGEGWRSKQTQPACCLPAATWPAAAPAAAPAASPSTSGAPGSVDVVVSPLGLTALNNTEAIEEQIAAQYLVVKAQLATTGATDDDSIEEDSSAGGGGGAGGVGGTGRVGGAGPAGAWEKTPSSREPWGAAGSARGPGGGGGAVAPPARTALPTRQVQTSVLHQVGQRDEVICSAPERGAGGPGDDVTPVRDSLPARQPAPSPADGAFASQCGVGGRQAGGGAYAILETPLAPPSGGSGGGRRLSFTSAASGECVPMTPLSPIGDGEGAGACGPAADVPAPESWAAGRRAAGPAGPAGPGPGSEGGRPAPRQQLFAAPGEAGGIPSPDLLPCLRPVAEVHFPAPVVLVAAGGPSDRPVAAVVCRARAAREGGPGGLELFLWQMAPGDPLLLATLPLAWPDAPAPGPKGRQLIQFDPSGSRLLVPTALLAPPRGTPPPRGVGGGAASGISLLALPMLRGWCEDLVSIGAVGGGAAGSGHCGLVPKCLLATGASCLVAGGAGGRARGWDIPREKGGCGAWTFEGAEGGGWDLPLVPPRGGGGGEAAAVVELAAVPGRDGTVVARCADGGVAVWDVGRRQLLAAGHCQGYHLSAICPVPHTPGAGGGEARLELMVMAGPVSGGGDEAQCMIATLPLAGKGSGDSGGGLVVHGVVAPRCRGGLAARWACGACSTDEGELLLWDVARGECRGIIEVLKGCRGVQLALHPSCRALVAGGSDGRAIMCYCVEG